MSCHNKLQQLCRKILIKDNGGEFKQSIAIPKREVDEGEALNEMRSDTQLFIKKANVAKTKLRRVI